MVARLMSKGSELKTNVFPDPHEILRAAPYRQCHAHYRTTEFDFHQEVRIIAREGAGTAYLFLLLQTWGELKTAFFPR